MPNRPVDTSQWPSAEELSRRITEDNISVTELARQLGASRTRVGRYLRGDNPHTQSPVADEERTAQCDVAFIEAMRAAIKAGAEKVKIGIKTDPTPLVPHRFAPDMVFSGAGSPAAMCSLAAGSMTFTRS